jgi:hypothetical protein
LLVLLSGGLFGFAWLLLMLRDANLAAGKHEDAVLSAIFLGLLALYFVMYAATMVSQCRRYSLFR